MQTEPLFSVIMPVYNGKDTVEAAIDSVLCQTFTNFELIIVDDCSCDSTPAILQKYAETDAVRLLRHEKNAGVSVTRNDGIEAAKGEYICFLDSDDSYFPDHLATLQSMIAAYPEEVFFITSHRDVLTDGSFKDIISYAGESGAMRYPDYLKGLLDKKIKPNMNSVCFKKCAFYETGMFLPGFSLDEDREFFLRCGLYHDAIVSGTVTTLRSRMGEGLTHAYRYHYSTCVDQTIGAYLARTDIPSERLQSLRRFRETRLLSNINHLILDGEKEKARKLFRENSFSLVPFKKRLKTLAALVLPASLVKARVLKKRALFYQEN